MTWIARAWLTAFSLIICYFLFTYFGKTAAMWGVAFFLALVSCLDLLIGLCKKAMDTEEDIAHESEKEEDILARIYN